MALFVPARKGFGIAQPESSAEIDYLDAAIEEAGSKSDGYVRRSCQENQLEFLLADGVKSGWNRFGRSLAKRRGALFGVGTMLQQNDFNAGMARKKPD